MPVEFENPICEGRKIVELDLRRAQSRQKFANSSRIHEDVDATSGRGTGCAPRALRADRANGVAVETISVVLPRSVCLRFFVSSLCLRSVIKKEYSEEA
jgi:hypothetical protein